MIAAQPTDVSIRPAASGDIDVIASIWQTGWADGHAGRVPPELERQRRNGSWSREVERRLPHTWVAECDGDVVGFVTVVGDEVEDIYVTPAARGSGVAKLLLRHGEVAVRDAGFTTAWLAVVAGNDRARRFYEREGWQNGGAFEHRARIEAGPIVVPALRYVLLVAPVDASNDALDAAAAELPVAIVARMRTLLTPRGGVVEEPAWTGVRWRYRSTTIAHIVMIADGWPPAYAHAAATNGPQCVLTVRCPREEVEALAAAGRPYFAPPWGVAWTPSVLGIRLDDATDWTIIAEHIDASYQLATAGR